MKTEKRILAELTKCYSIAPLHYQGKDFFLVAAEKNDPCYLFGLDGEFADKLWDGPGGVMCMVQVPGSDGQFLAIHEFYSPNDSGNAGIVAVMPRRSGGWERKRIISLPHVHRFDLLSRDGQLYLIACTLKSGHQYKDDWSMPGRVYAAKLPADFFEKGCAEELHLTVIRDQMLKNHGFYRLTENGIQSAVISAENGVFRFTPPAAGGDQWTVETLLETAASDAALVDLDGDGEKELAVLAPFHGDQLTVYKKDGERYREIYACSVKTEFLHAVCEGKLCGRAAVFIGYRKADRGLFALVYDHEKEAYTEVWIDRECGPANVFYYRKDGKDILISANREINEVAMYILKE